MWSAQANTLRVSTRAHTHALTCHTSRTWHILCSVLFCISLVHQVVVVPKSLCAMICKQLIILIRSLSLFQHNPVGCTFQHNLVACNSQHNSRNSRRCRVGGRAYHCVLASTFRGKPPQGSTGQGSTGLRSCSAHLVPSPQPFAISTWVVLRTFVPPRIWTWTLVVLRTPLSLPSALGWPAPATTSGSSAPR